MQSTSGTAAARFESINMDPFVLHEPYEFIGFGAMDGPKPYEFIWFMCILSGLGEKQTKPLKLRDSYHQTEPPVSYFPIPVDKVRYRWFSDAGGDCCRRPKPRSSNNVGKCKTATKFHCFCDFRAHRKSGLPLMTDVTFRIVNKNQ